MKTEAIKSDPPASVYLDDDDIPELHLRCSENVFSSDIYTVKNGQITHLSLYDFKGEKCQQYNNYTDCGDALADYYIEKKGLTYFISHGFCWLSYGVYALKEGKLEEISYVKYAWEQVFDDIIDDVVGDNDYFLYRYRKKDGTLYCCREKNIVTIPISIMTVLITLIKYLNYVCLK